VVLSRDIRRIPVRELLTTRVEYTVFNGKLVCQAADVR
jgi:predicted amidohydrolase YtcJ